MGFGGKFASMPTPGRIVFWSKIIQKLIGIGIAVIALRPETLTTKTIGVVLGGFIAIMRDIEDGFGVHVPGPVHEKDIEVIKQEAIKTIIFITLVNTYLFNF